MVEVRVLTMLDKKNAYVLGQVDSTLPVATVLRYYRLHRTGFPYLSVFHPNFTIEEEYIRIDSPRPTYTQARNQQMEFLRKAGLNVI